MLKTAIRIHKQPDDPDFTVHDQIEIDRETWFRNPADVKKFRDYSEGTHKRTYTDTQANLLEGVLDNDYCDNVCHLILTTNASRLEMQRWDVDDDAAAQFLETFWVRAGMDMRQGDLHYDVLRDGNTCLSLAWDNDQEQVIIQRELWWDGASGVFVGYDAQGEPLYAVKEWQTFEGIRRTIWYEDRLERYMSQGGANWVPYTLPTDKLADDGGPIAQEWAKADGSPLHIPIIHFANAGRGKHVYGMSELAGGVLGFQDQINDLQYDLSAAGRMTAFQQLYATGCRSPQDATGNDVPWAVGPGQVFHSTEQGARFGAIAAGSIAELINEKREKKQDVAIMTRTPMHVLEGVPPSGEALLRMDQPLVDKATQQIAKFKGVWATVAHRAIEIANTFGKAGLSEDDMITAVFKPPERRDKLSISTALRNMSSILSDAEALREYGYTPDQVEKILAERKEQVPVIVTERVTDAVAGSAPAQPAGDITNV